MNHTNPSIRLIGIAGGSGSGKSTLANTFCQKYPDFCTVVHIDDYYKTSEHVPKVNGINNWDHPDALKFDELQKNLLLLKNGQSITLLTNSELGIYKPTYNETTKKYGEYVTRPHPIIFVEGHLSLYDKNIRDILDTRIFLDIPVEKSINRRALNKFVPEMDYLINILFPMHIEFVQPTKQYADTIFDATKLTSQEIFEKIEKLLNVKD